MNGAEALITSLAGEGVEIIFGLPGVQVMEALDAVYHQPKIRWVSVRHEQTAAYMAFGYARTTGKIGVALVVPGPGALNTTAAIGTAYATSTPVLLVSGQVESYNLGRKSGALHEISEQSDVFSPLTKWCHRATRVEDIPRAVQTAMYHLRTGRPRPVELEILWDVMQKSASVDLLEPKPAIMATPEPAQINAAVQALSDAQHPVIWAGGGVISSDAARELTLIAECLNAPVITTPEGKGAIPGRHPLSLGVYYYGHGPAKRTIPQADVILAVGSRLHFPMNAPVHLNNGKKLIQIDVDADEVGRNRKVHVGIVSDARTALRSLLDALPEKPKSTWSPEELEEIKAETARELKELAPLQLEIVRTIRSELNDDDIVIPGITNIGYWSLLSYPVLSPRTYCTTSYFATLGYAFPTALGAQMGNPSKRVVAICGDGGFMYALPDLATAVQEGINVIALVFTDQAFGASLHDQQRRFESRIIGTRFQNPDFASIAEAFGSRGMKLSGPEQLGEGLKMALREDRPAVIEIPVPTMATPF
jgi:acetolactate synthase-1/2/3 large subunit